MTKKGLGTSTGFNPNDNPNMSMISKAKSKDAANMSKKDKKYMTMSKEVIFPSNFR